MIATSYCRYLAQVPHFSWGNNTNLGTKAKFAEVYAAPLLYAPRTSRPHDYSSFICNCRGSVASGQDYVYLYDRVLLNYNPAAYSSTGQHTLEVSRDEFRGV